MFEQLERWWNRNARSTLWGGVLLILSLLLLKELIGCSYNYIDLTPEDDAAGDSEQDTGHSEEAEDSAEDSASELDDVAVTEDGAMETTEAEAEAEEGDASADVLPDIPDEVEPDSPPEADSEPDAGAVECDALDVPDDDESEKEEDGGVGVEPDAVEVPDAPDDYSEPEDIPSDGSPPDTIEDEATEDAPTDTDTRTVICSDWDATGTSIEPFVGAPYLWTGTRDPTRAGEWVAVTDRAAVFRAYGSWMRAEAFAVVSIQGASPAPGYLRHLWMIGNPYFVAVYIPTTRRYVDGNDGSEWTPVTEHSIEHVVDCTGAPWSEFYLDGELVYHRDEPTCPISWVYAFTIAPGYLAEWSSSTPHDSPPRPLLTGGVYFRSFCFTGTPG